MHNVSLYSFVEQQARDFQDQGQLEVARILFDLVRWAKWAAEGGHPVIKIFKRAVLTILVMLALSLASLIFSSALTMMFLFLTIAVLLIFVYAFWVQTEIPILNPRVLIYAILLSIALAAVVLANMFLVG